MALTETKAAQRFMTDRARAVEYLDQGSHVDVFAADAAQLLRAAPVIEAGLELDGRTSQLRVTLGCARSDFDRLLEPESPLRDALEGALEAVSEPLPTRYYLSAVFLMSDELERRREPPMREITAGQPDEDDGDPPACW